MFERILFAMVALLHLCGPGDAPSADDRLKLERAVASFRRKQERPVWSEVTEGKLQIRSIRWIGKDAAVVEGSVDQFGSLMMKRVKPIRVLVRRKGVEWQAELELYGCPGEVRR